MEMLLLSGVSAGALAWVALPGGLARGRSRVVQAWRLRAALKAVGRSWPASALSGWKPWQEVADHVVIHAHRHHVALNLDEAMTLMWLACLATGCLLAFLTFEPLALLVGAALPTCAPAVARALEQQARVRDEHVLPDAYRSLSVALSSGQTLTQAIGYVAAHVQGAPGAAFETASFELTCGASVDQALTALEQKLPRTQAGLLVCALSVSQQTGAPLAELLREAAALLDERTTLSRLLTTKTAQVRLSARVVMAMPPLLVGVLVLISPDFRAGLVTPVGVGSLVVAAVLMAVAHVAMKRVLKSVTL